jgi:hypothetical protein
MTLNSKNRMINWENQSIHYFSFINFLYLDFESKSIRKLIGQQKTNRFLIKSVPTGS